MDRRTGALPVFAALLPEHGPPLVVAADTPRSPLTHHLPNLRDFLDEEPVAVFGVVQLGVQEGAEPLGLDWPRGGGPLVPPVLEERVGELRDPQGHRDREPVAGELAHKWGKLIPERFAWVM